MNTIIGILLLIIAFLAIMVLKKRSGEHEGTLFSLATVIFLASIAGLSFLFTGLQPLLIQLN